MDIHIHIHQDPGVGEALARIEATLANQQQENRTMGRASTEAIDRLTTVTAGLTTEIESVGAYIDANIQAQRDLAAELEADGVDATKIHALADAQEANKARLVAMILKGTPSDPGTPIPDPIST